MLDSWVRRRPAVIATVASLVFALGAGVFMAAAPCAVRSQTSSGAISWGDLPSGDLPSGDLPSEGGEVRSRMGCMSLVQSQGPMVLWILVAPGLLCAAGVAGSTLGFRWLTWIAAIVLLLLVLLTGFSIGLLFFPAALLLVLGAALQHADLVPSPGRISPPSGER